VIRKLRGAFGAALALAACGSPASPPQNVIQFEIDDHGLSALWVSDAPNLKGLISRGVFGFSRVQIPTHSNQGNYSTLTGQQPDGNEVPGNTPLDRPGFTYHDVAGQEFGDYALYPDNPLRTRGDSVYQAAERLGIQPSFFGQIPPLDVGAADVHFTILGATIDGTTLTYDLGTLLLEGLLDYPEALVPTFHFDGPPAQGETISHFTFRDVANFIDATGPGNPMPRYMYVWDFLALDNNPTGDFGAEIVTSIEDYDDALGDILDALDAKGLLASTNIVFTLDHGKVDTHDQACLGTQGGGAGGTADGQMAQVIASQGAQYGLTEQSYQLFQEDGDVLLYAAVPNVGTAAAAPQQMQTAHELVQLVQSGALQGVDTTRTITFDGYLGTRKFHDLRDETPNQADVMLFGLPDWTLNQVDGSNAAPGPFKEHTQYPYGRHGGLSTEELYVPVIMAGPAFKSGVMLPHPVAQSDVAPTAMWALGAGYLTTATGAPILAAFKGQPGETIPQPVDMTTAQATILAGAGFGARAPAFTGGTAPSAVIVDVAGLYYDEVFADQDPSLRAAAQPFLDLAAQGTVFDHFWTRYRDWPVNEYEMLVGGYPVQLPYIPFAEDDPSQVAPPGFGFLMMPVPAGFVADQAGYQAWRQTTPFAANGTVFDAAAAAGLSTALIGQLDYHDAHVDTSALTLHETLAQSAIPGAVASFLGSHGRSLVVVAVGGQRTADRHSAAAAAELASLAATVQGIADAAYGSLVLVTSRGATTIDDPGADFYGPGTSRHVPLLVLGPDVRPAVTTSQDGQLADIPATALVALGLTSRTDFVDGTWAAGTPVGGIAQPTPAGATAGHALLRAFLP